MNQPIDENQKITEYLLGSLNDAETEKFDELSFTDDEFAAALDAAEKDLVDAFARGELSGERLEKFKSNYLITPLRREKVAFAETLQIYAQKKSVGQSKKSIAGTEEKSAGFFAFLDIFRNVNYKFASILVVVLLIVMLGGFWIFNNRRNSESEIARQNPTPTAAPVTPTETPSAQNTNDEVPPVKPSPETKLPVNQAVNKVPKVESTVAPTPARSPEPQKIAAPPVIASFILAAPLRSANKLPQFDVPPNAAQINVTLQLETDDFSAYRVVLTDQTGSRTLWRGGTTKSFEKGENKSLNAHFPAKLLKSNIYTLTVSGINAAGEAEIISNYPFRSVLK